MSIWVELRDSIFFSHFVQRQMCSKDKLTQRRCWSCRHFLVPYHSQGLELLKRTTCRGWGQEDLLTGTGRSSLAWWVGRTSWRPRQPRVPRPPAAQLPAASDHGGSISPPGSRAVDGANTGGGGAVEKEKEEVVRTMPSKGTGTSLRSFQYSTRRLA